MPRIDQAMRWARSNKLRRHINSQGKYEKFAKHMKIFDFLSWELKIANWNASEKKCLCGNDSVGTIKKNTRKCQILLLWWGGCWLFQSKQFYDRERNNYLNRVWTSFVVSGMQRFGRFERITKAQANSCSVQQECNEETTLRYATQQNGERKIKTPIWICTSTLTSPIGYPDDNANAVTYKNKPPLFHQWCVHQILVPLKKKWAAQGAGSLKTS